MKLQAALLATLATVKLTAAHTTVFAAWINDVDQGVGNTPDGYIRSPPNNNPVKDVTSKDMTCNVNGNNAAAKTLSVKAGDKFTFEWHHNSRDASDDIIDPSHKGPVMVYIAPTTAGASGSGWVKIYEDGYDATTQKWAVEKLITNKGLHSVTIPNIAAGDYLLRPEIIALHEANRIGGAQLYMECVQIKVTSSGDALPAGVSIPGAYSATDPGINFDLYSGSIQNYPFPGPAVWSGAGGNANMSSPAGTTSGSGSASTSASASASASASSASSPASSAFAPTTMLTSTTQSSMSASSASASSSAGSSQSGTAAQFQQCGGMNYNGPTNCASGLTCKVQNPYYSQCLM